MKDTRSFHIRRLDRVRRTLRVSLLAFSCLVLNAPNLSRSENSAHQTPDGASYEGWRSCAGLIHSTRPYSAADVQAMFERPEDIREFLQNIKLAWEQDWLLRPSFYDVATLMKFFNGTKVTWNGPDPFFKNLHTELIKGSVVSDAFPGIIAKFESNCSIIDYKVTSGVKQSKVEGNGFLNVEVASVPEITLQNVRNVFGHEAGQSIDLGVDPHGNTFATKEKGSVVYTKAPIQGAPNSRVEMVFYFKAKKSQQDLDQLSGVLVDGDSVTRITMHDVQGNTVGN